MNSQNLIFHFQAELGHCQNVVRDAPHWDTGDRKNTSSFPSSGGCDSKKLQGHCLGFAKYSAAE